MKTKTKIITFASTLILALGLLFTLPATQSEAAGDEEFCSELNPMEDIICEGEPVNCLCPIIITPDEDE